VNSKVRLIVPGAALVIVISLLSFYSSPERSDMIYIRTDFFRLAFDHIFLVASSSAAACSAGVFLGVFVTRDSGRGFLPVVNMLASLGQTFPPVAVLAIAVPLVGFGAKPTVIALICYGIFPIVRNTIAGLETVSPDVKEAAEGMGMTKLNMLFKVELPLSAPIIIAGIRTSVIINIGTAAIGATIGAGGFGAPIISGLINNNFYYVLQGGLCVALLAVFADELLNILSVSYSEI